MPITNNPFANKAKPTKKKIPSFSLNTISGLGLGNPRAVLKAKSLSEQTKAIGARRIGGKPDEARNEFWRQEPVMQHAVDSIAGRYNISSDALRYRLDREGFTDNAIRMRNYAIDNPNWADIQEYSGYNLLHNDKFGSGFSLFGLDDTGSLIREGKVNPINESWYDVDATNEKGRQTKAATAKDTAGNMGLTAATLKYFIDTAKQDNPNLSDEEATRYGLAYYNRGVKGGREWSKSGAKGYNYRRRLESRGKLTK